MAFHGRHVGSHSRYTFKIPWSFRRFRLSKLTRAMSMSVCRLGGPRLIRFDLTWVFDPLPAIFRYWKGGKFFEQYIADFIAKINGEEEESRSYKKNLGLGPRIIIKEPS